jgi:hypothetical protein
MLRLRLTSVLAFMLLVVPSPASAKTQDPVVKLLKMVEQTLKCNASKAKRKRSSADSAGRIWCLVAKGWSKAKHTPLPTGTRAWLGTTLRVSKHTNLKTALQHQVSLSAIGFRGSRHRFFAKMERIQPRSSKEIIEIGKVVAALTGFFEGKRKTVGLTGTMGNRIRLLASQARNPVRRMATGWQLRSRHGTELRKIGPYWVSIETVKQSAKEIWLSIFTRNYTIR